MTHYHAEQRFPKPHGKQLQAYLDRMKRRPKAICYNPPNKDGERWVEYPENGLRFIGKAHDVYNGRAIDHTGWFIDNYQEETICGMVYQLPTRNGEERYLIGVSDPWNDAASIDFSRTYDDPRDAALASDSWAERRAEEEREFQEYEGKRQEAWEIEDEIKESYKHVREQLQECREARVGPSLCSMIRSAIRREIEEIREKRDRRTKLLEDVAWYDRMQASRV